MPLFKWIAPAGGGGGIQPSPNPALTNAFFKVRDQNGNPITTGVVFVFTLLDPLSTTDAWTQKVTNSATSDITGLVQILLPIAQLWRVTGPDGRFRDFNTGTQTTLRLPTYVGSF